MSSNGVHISIIPETIVDIFGVPITNTLITSWIVMAVLIALAFFVRREITRGRLTTFTLAAESIIDGLVGFFSTIAGDRRSAEKHFTVAATIFLFVLAANWIGILPGVGSIGILQTHGEERVFIPLLRSVYSDLNMTLALALIAVTLSHVAGLFTLGIWPYLSKFIRLKNPLDFFVGLLEMLSETAKLISFSFRLFGNVFAGEVLLVIMTFLVPYLAPAPFLALELFVGFIQALIFSVLTMLFLSTAERVEVHH